MKQQTLTACLAGHPKVLQLLAPSAHYHALADGDRTRFHFSNGGSTIAIQIVIEPTTESMLIVAVYGSKTRRLR